MTHFDPFEPGVVPLVLFQTANPPPDPLERDDLPSREELFSHAFDFEKLIAGFYRRMGFQVIETGGRRELGADLIVVHEGWKTAIQVKCSARLVGVRAIRQASRAAGAYDTNAVRVVTNSFFTYQAQKEAEGRGIRLTPRDDLLRKLDLSEQKEFMRIDHLANERRYDIGRLRGRGRP